MKAKVRFEYYRPQDGKMKRYHRGMMAWAPDATGGQTYAHVGIPRLNIGLSGGSRCRSDEQFCYRTGRRLASARLYELLCELGLEGEVEWPGDDPDYYKRSYQSVFDEIFMQGEQPDPLASIKRFVEKSPDHPVARLYAAMLKNDMEYTVEEYQDAGALTARRHTREIEEWKKKGQTHQTFMDRYRFGDTHT